MSTITIQISAPEMIDAINNLAKAQLAAAEALNRLASGSSASSAPATAALPPAPAAQRPNLPAPPYIDPRFNIPAKPAPQPLPKAPSLSRTDVPQPNGQPPRVGDTGITFDEIVTAVATLMGAGKYLPVVELLGKFGVQALHQLPKEYFGTFAAALRQMGAQI